jgi:crotonobetainyl-CoA:carnitine CoA-transferase CaiB-like acyl-CoA transferase
MLLAGFADGAEHVDITGREPILPSPIPLADAAAMVLGACGGAAASLWHGLTGEWQRASVNLREAATALDSYRRLELVESTRRVQIPPPVRDALSVPHQAGDGRWIHLSGTQPHLRAGTLRTLGCAPTDAEVSRAVGARASFALESQLSEAGVPAAVYRTSAEWSEHDQGHGLHSVPLVEIERISASPREPHAPPGGAPRRPLDGIRIVDLSRVLAGPSTVKLLALFGADAIRLTRPGAFEDPAVTVDTGFGKLAAWLDVDRQDHRHALENLVAQADVLVENSRFGSLARKGFGVEHMTRLRPGLIYVSLNCYGHTGPWRQRRGYEPHADAATGLRTSADPHVEPDPFFRTVSDYTTGWLGTLGVMGALRRRAIEGGSYHVRVSLARTAMWVHSLKRVDPEAASGLGDVEQFMTTSITPYGKLRHCRPPITFSDAPLEWSVPTAPFGMHQPVWPTAHDGRQADARA